MASKKSKTHEKKITRVVENCILLWLDSNLQKTSDEYREALNLLEPLVNTILLIRDPDEYHDYVNSVNNETIFIIISDDLHVDSVSIMEDTPSIDSIYIFHDRNEYLHKQLRKFRKIKGIFPNIKSIRDALRRDLRQVNNDLIPISILSSSSDEFNQSFRASWILRDTLINSEYHDQTRGEFHRFCHSEYSHRSNIIEEYIKKCKPDLSIQWYTREDFLYAMLNRALRLYDMEILVNMAFFVHDLHRQIREIHHSKLDEKQQSLTVYHSQFISNDRLVELQNNIDGLIAFRTFLIATPDEELALHFAGQSRSDPRLRSVLFKIRIDRTTTPSSSAFPFVFLDELDYYKDTDRHVLFSLNTPFEIRKVRQVEDQLWQVDLSVIKNNDPRIETVTNWIETTFEGLYGFLRISQMMIGMNKQHKAKELYEILLKYTTEENESILAYIHRKLGTIYRHNNDFDVALDHYRKSLALEMDCSPIASAYLWTIYTAMGDIQHEQNSLEDALESYRKSLEVCEHDPRMGFSLHNLGLILQKQGKSNEAQENFERALTCYDESSPSGRDLLSKIHYSLSVLCESHGQYKQARRHANDALQALEGMEPSHDREKKECEQLLHRLHEQR